MKIFLFLNLLFLYQSIEYIEEILADEIKTYSRKESEFLHFKFISKEDESYVIIFPNQAYIKEIKGEIHQDIKYQKNEEYISKIYIQNFKKGDYVKIVYPVFKAWEAEELITIRIGKIYSNSRILNNDNKMILTKEFSDCNKPLYILLSNRYYNSHLGCGYFTGLIHSGYFYASYKINNYTYMNESLKQNYQKVNISEYNELPLYDFNIVKLQCKKPGIITFLINFFKDGSPDKGMSLVHLSNKCSLYQIDFSPSDFAGHPKLYIQMFKIIGCSRVDLTEFGGGKNYSATCGNFISSYNIGEPTNIFTYRLSTKTNENNSVLFSIINKEKVDNEIILLNENKVYFINNYTYRIIIPLNNRNKKKYIKIISSLNQFSWAYEFSQVNNTNYLGRPHSSIETLANNNNTYIYNPLFFDGKKTNYFWFIIITCKNYENLTISYIYTDKIGKEEESLYVNDINKTLTN